MKAIAVILFCLCFGFIGSFAQNTLEITHLKGDFYVFTTWQTFKESRFPSNGLYLVTNAGVVMIDTPWDTTQFQPLLDTIRKRHDARVVLCIATHAHADRTGGLEYYAKHGVKTFTSYLTDRICVDHHEKRAQYTFKADTTFNVGQYTFEAYYPGEGHTIDNHIIWFPGDGVLYGGCLVKSTEAENLGNITEANVKAWPTTITNLKKKYGTPPFIIPGHQEWSDNRSLDHTLRLLSVSK